MICKVLSRVSKNKYRVQSETSGIKLTVLDSSSESYRVEDYVVVIDLCIIGRSTGSKFDGVYRV